MTFKENQILLILDKLGIEISGERNSELSALCPGHELRTGRPDHSPSWNINSETGLHNCFSCGYKGNIVTLVAEQLEMVADWGTLDIAAAKAWLQKNTEVDLEYLIKQMTRIKDSYIAIPKPVPMSAARLAIFDEPPTWAMDQRGLTQDGCESYNILWEPKDALWVLPIYSSSGALLGWQEKGAVNRHFKNRPTGVAKSQSLFGSPTQLGFDQYVIVESPLDAVRLKSIGINGAMALYGTGFSTMQLDMISRSKEPPIIAFDNPAVDSAGKAASLKFLEVARERGLEFKFFNYGESQAKDIGDMNLDEIYWGVEKAKHCVLGKASIGG